MGVAKFDGKRWIPVQPHVELDGAFYDYGGTYCMTTWDRDGTGPLGPSLVLGGQLYGYTAAQVVMIDQDGSWSQLGAEFATDYTLGILAVETYAQDAGAPRLFATANASIGLGTFGPLYGIGEYDPVTSRWFSPAEIDLGSSGTAQSLLRFDDGSGAKLYAAGSFPGARQATGPILGSQNIIRYDGVQWSAMGGGLPHAVGKLLSFDDDGSGPNPARLVAVGTGAVSFWNGSTWNTVTLPNSDGATCIAPSAAAVFDYGTGPKLYVGSNHCSSGNFLNEYYVFNGTSFDHVPSMGTGRWTMLASVQTPAGPRLLNDMLKVWDGTSSTDFGVSNPVQNRPGVISSMLEWDPDGAGPLGNSIVAGGTSGYSSGAMSGGVPAGRWDGTAWTAMNAGLPGAGGENLECAVTHLIHDLQTPHSLIATVRDFSDSESGIYRWTGNGPWLKQGGSFRWSDGLGEAGRPFYADFGGGPQLFCVGRFATVGTSTIHHLALWNGSAWVSVGGGLTPVSWYTSGYESSHKTVVMPFNDGNGTRLFVSGTISHAGGVPLSKPMAMWDGSNWLEASAGLPAMPTGCTVPGDALRYELEVIDGSLYAWAEGFCYCGGVCPPADARVLYKWNSASSSWVRDPNGTLSSVASAEQYLGTFTVDETGPRRFVSLGTPNNTTLDNRRLSFMLRSQSVATNEWRDELERFGGFTFGGVQAMLRSSVGGEDALLFGGSFWGVDGEGVPGFPGQRNAVAATPSPGFARYVLTCVATCDGIDFNGDGLFPDDTDLVDFLSVLAGGPCSNDPNCGDIDFNGDGLFPDDSDLIAFLRVLAGGNCEE